TSFSYVLLRLTQRHSDNFFNTLHRPGRCLQLRVGNHVRTIVPSPSEKIKEWRGGAARIISS
ncbi:MAG: hypothetical protein MZV70_56860, partial [Desulfobacterales bacterium]|nr:hypothetical protein [Desulfobacterales bacterium]